MRRALVLTAATLLAAGSPLHASAAQTPAVPPAPEALPTASPGPTPAPSPEAPSSAIPRAPLTGAPASLAGARYVAIGSSFAAGPMLPPPKPGAPTRCGQSLSNYPTLLAERFAMQLTDRSCSGATTDNVLGPWNEIAPQIAAVTPETRLVTLTIGGNDLSYIGNLFTATCAFHARAAAASGGQPKACQPLRVPGETDYARVETQMTAIVAKIRTIAPQARIVLVQYLTPLPAGPLCAVTPVSPEDAAVVRTIGSRLAEITDRVAAATGTMVVEMNLASAQHTPCDAQPWLIGAPKNYDGKQGLQWHLNKAGMQATADAITLELVRNGFAPPPVPKTVPQTTAPKTGAPQTGAPRMTAPVSPAAAPTPKPAPKPAATPGAQSPKAAAPARPRP